MEKSRVNIYTLPKQMTGNIIIVGDIHGSKDEFNNLLKECNFRQGIDTLIHVGDLVNKGRDSKGVVERCMELGAIGVVGNHDDTLMECYDEHKTQKYTPEELKKDPVKRLAKYIGQRCIDYLRSLPHVIRIPQYNLIIVHAGINPYLPLEKQIPDDLVSMRTVMADGKAVAKGSIDGTMWAKVWAGPETIIFGHDAKTGLQVEEFALGIDTGCCYGKELTAVMYPGKKIVSVPGAPIRRREDSVEPETPSSTQVPFSPDAALMTPSMIRNDKRPSFTGTTPPLVPTPGSMGSPAPSWPSAPPNPIRFSAEPTPGKGSEGDETKKELLSAMSHAVKIIAETKDVKLFLALVRGDAYQHGWHDLVSSEAIGFDTWKDIVWMLAKGLAPAESKAEQAEMLGFLQDILVEREDVKDNVCFILRAQLQSDQQADRIKAERPLKAVMLLLR